MTAATLKKLADAAIAARADDLVELSRLIHGTPEVAYEEHEAARRIAGLCDTAGFDTAVGVAGLDTAVVARSGSGGLGIAYCAEYDALPDIGHACGHNLFAG